MQEKKMKEIIVDEIVQSVGKINLNELEIMKKENLSMFTALAIADKYNVSRNLVSHYLHQLLNERKVCRINGRPVLYLPTEYIEKQTSYQFQKFEFDNIKEFCVCLGLNEKRVCAFRELIGVEGSLSYCVEQCKAAVNYPGNGLPILLFGPTGAGKSMLARCMYEYAREIGKIKKESQFVTVNCAEYSNNPEFLLTNLFGYCKGAYTGAQSDRDGLISLAEGGILFLDEVHALKPECQEKIFLFMDKGIYHKVGDNETWYEGNVHIIFATTEDPKECLLKTLLRRIPITTILPPLSQRPLQEKRELINFLLFKESQNIKQKIYISKMGYQVLEQTTFIGNVGELKNNIKAAVAKSLMNSKNDDKVEIHIFDLPQSLFDTQNIELSSCDDNTLIDITEVTIDQSNSYLYNFSIFVLNSFRQYKNKDELFPSFAYSMHDRVEQYIDYLCSDTKEKNTATHRHIMSLMGHIFQIIAQKYHLSKVSNNEIMVISYLIIEFFSSTISDIENYEENRQRLNCMLDLIKDNYLTDYYVAVDTAALVNDALHLNIGRIGILHIFLFFHYFDRDMKKSAIPGVIISHGYSIASGIAEIANQLLNRHVFDAIDMPINSDFNMILQRLKNYLEVREECKEYIVLVDMGSLENMYLHLESVPDMDIGIINNVSTKLALDIGSMILDSLSISEILEEASTRNINNYKIIYNRKKQSVVLTVCETGIGTAEKIAELIEKSLPETRDIRIIPYDYKTLKETGNCSAIHEKFKVLGIIGTKDPKIKDTIFVSIEELLEQKEIDKIIQIFNKNLDNMQIEQLNQNIIRNFSIGNLLNYITILDTEKIIDNVRDIVSYITEKLSLHLPSKVIMGLYIHISCLVERLILSRRVAHYENVEFFEKEHSEFVKIVYEAFKEVEKLYNVKIPIDEIGYIYEYIYHRHVETVNNHEESVNEFENL